MRMKQEKRTDKEISETLIGSGRVKYTTKSIGGRWKRLRAVMSKARDEALDLGLVSWLAEEVNTDGFAKIITRLLTFDRITRSFKRSTLPTGSYSSKSRQ